MRPLGIRFNGGRRVDAHDRAALVAGEEAALPLERAAGDVLVRVARQQAEQDKLYPAPSGAFLTDWPRQQSRCETSAH